MTHFQASLFRQILDYFAWRDPPTRPISCLLQLPMMVLLSKQRLVLPSLDLFVLLVFELCPPYS